MAPLSPLTFAVVTTHSQLFALVPEWLRLFYTAAPRNPFAHPSWLVTWARHFIKPTQLYILCVRDATGQLVAVAPFYRKRHPVAGGVAATQLLLLGTGQHAHLTEMPQILIAPGLERKVLRGIVQYLGDHADEWDWVDVVLPPHQGWFEPQWVATEGPGARSMVLHKAARPFVVLPLPPTWEELRAGMKRNVKESIRHGVNSLTRAGYTAKLVLPHDVSDFKTALDTLVILHRGRAAMRTKVRHDDYFADPSDVAFWYDVGPRLFEEGHLIPYLLEVDGTPIAARLVLHANGTTFFSFSGFDPDWWRYNVATTLMAECLRDAIGRGSTLANLSLGPDEAKLRWSEQLDVHQEFAIIGPRRLSRLAFSLYWQRHSYTRLKKVGQAALCHRRGLSP